MSKKWFPITLLGQSGCVFEFPEAVIYVDPYLSNSVKHLDAPDLERQTPIPMQPSDVTDASWVLLTHAHIDHCDPHTVPHIASASPSAQFIGPIPVVSELKKFGINDSRINLAREEWFVLAAGLRVRAMPAAHPQLERDSNNHLVSVGYLIEYHGRRVYVAGDTSIHEEVIESLIREAPIDLALLPVNEQNFFRQRRGIIGNMSVREAFGLADEVGIRTVIPVHWDMFEVNSVFPQEINLVHSLGGYKSRLQMDPTAVNLSRPDISIVIRTLNEEKYLDDLLSSVELQVCTGKTIEVVIVDSGSNDRTLDIAARYGATIVHISKEEFSFGRSLNIGCEAASGDVIAITSGHCVPVGDTWLDSLCTDIFKGNSEYVYGRQIGGKETHFSEQQIFKKYFPKEKSDQQGGSFCNNANSAILRTSWQKLKFDENLTGLEDIDMAQRLIANGGAVNYVPDAVVLHLHDETWPTVRRRFEREAIALQKIMPQLHFGKRDRFRYFIDSVLLDFKAALKARALKKSFVSILRYRWEQYAGSYVGNKSHKEMSQKQKNLYFYPD